MKDLRKLDILEFIEDLLEVKMFEYFPCGHPRNKDNTYIRRYPSGPRKDKVRSRECRRCRCKRSFEVNKKRPWLKKAYGITFEQFLNLLDKQAYICLICEVKLDPYERKTCIDHDHKTGKIRGILCNPCNLIIGHARDDCFILKKAILYLKSHA